MRLILAALTLLTTTACSETALTPQPDSFVAVMPDGHAPNDGAATDDGSKDDGSEDDGSGDDGISPKPEVWVSDGDSPKPNDKPTIGPLPALTLKMGTSEVLDLAPLLDDTEDEDTELSLSWGAAHVALKIDESLQLLVVAPVDWFGVENIVITALDSGGKEATATLVVTVVEVEPPDDPVDPPDCSTSFAVSAPGAQSVMLAGNFNEWVVTGVSAIPMLDADGDDVFEATLTLDAGTYQYKFVVDDNWISDPQNPQQIDDGFGGKNSLLEVPTCE